MTIYYDPSKSLFVAAFACKHTIFNIVFHLEFWVYNAYHATLIVIFKYCDVHLGSFRWEAVGAMQFFLMFMLIFYNSNCYERYLEFYKACMKALRSAIFFIQELIISLPYGDVEKHRQIASRYMLATVYLFYMGITGGSAKGQQWFELQRKGLLTKKEARMLADYPGRVTLTLTSWSMQLVLKALDKDVFWGDQMPHVAHVHNRLQIHLVAMIRAMNRVHYLLAQPIPFLYFHLMNFILCINFFILGFALATFKTFWSIYAFGFAVLVYIGLRKVSVDLAEPFEQDSSDFPVHQFLDYSFDHSVGLLEAFSHPDAYDLVMENIHSTRPFTDEELTRSAVTTVNYEHHSVKANPFVWHKTMPFQNMTGQGKKHLKRQLTHTLVQVDKLKAAQQEIACHDEHKYELLMNKRDEARELRAELDEAQDHLRKLRTMVADQLTAVDVDVEALHDVADEHQEAMTEEEKKRRLVRLKKLDTAEQDDPSGASQEADESDLGTDRKPQFSGFVQGHHHHQDRHLHRVNRKVAQDEIPLPPNARPNLIGNDAYTANLHMHEAEPSDNPRWLSKPSGQGFLNFDDALLRVREELTSLQTPSNRTVWNTSHQDGGLMPSYVDKRLHRQEFRYESE